MSRTRYGKREKLDGFGRYVLLHLGVQFSDEQLEASLAAVRIRHLQEASKLSPVAHTVAENGKKRFRGVPPHCVSTYASFASCPPSCAFIGSEGVAGGCFVAANVNQRRCTNPLDDWAQVLPDEHRRDLLALAEAFTISTDKLEVPQDGALGGRDLRIHMAGDATTIFRARLFIEAAHIWELAGGGAIWTYTHAWRTVARAAWGPVSVLASVETGAAMRAAMARGYAAAIVVDRFPKGGKPFALADTPDVKVLPCPNEAGAISPKTRGRLTCVECRLCLGDRGLLERRHAIAFQAHGARKGAAMVSLARLQESARRSSSC